MRSTTRPTGAYEKIRRSVAAHAQKLGAEHVCWMVMGEGDVTTYVWLGAAAKMTKLKKLLRGVPPADLVFHSQRSSAARIVLAVRQGANPDISAGPRGSRRSRSR